MRLPAIITASRERTAALRYLQSGALPSDRSGRLPRPHAHSAPINDAALAAELDAIANRVRRNIPMNNRPDAFHEEKSEITRAISSIVDRLRRR